MIFLRDIYVSFFEDQENSLHIPVLTSLILPETWLPMDVWLSSNFYPPFYCLVDAFFIDHTKYVGKSSVHEVNVLV